MMTDRTQRLGLYIHFPFCLKKCGYCDFLSFPAAEETKEAYVSALRNEIWSRGKAYTGEVDTVYLGGGTPSVLPVHALLDVLREIGGSFRLATGAEITMEVNPGTIRELSDVLPLTREENAPAINRWSIGAQSFDDSELALLGRIHRSADTVRTVLLLREAGARNLSLDLIFGLPGQRSETFTRSLAAACALSPEHLSLYSLTIEEGTPFYARYAGHPELLPAEEDERGMYHDADEFLSRKGFRQYEISNYALPGKESRHNLRYWKRENYLGIGLGASSMMNNIRWKNTADMARYIQYDGCAPREERTVLTAREQMEEYMFLGLRMAQGVDEDAFFAQFGIPLTQEYGTVIARHLEDGLLIRENSRYYLSERGKDLANLVMADFLHDV